jgi:hypothetical protein
MNEAAESLPGANELAAFIVSSVKNEVIEGPIGERFDVEPLIDEAVLLEIAKDEIDKAVLPITQAVVARVQEDLTRRLNA